MTKEEALGAMTELAATLTEDEKGKLLSCMRMRCLDKNEVIYKEGEIPQELFCLIQGKVKIYIDGIGGRCQIVRVQSKCAGAVHRKILRGGGLSLLRKVRLPV